jgi:hypothetical protein
MSKDSEGFSLPASRGIPLRLIGLAPQQSTLAALGCKNGKSNRVPVNRLSKKYP